MDAKGIRHQFPTADVVIDPGQALFIVTDPEPTEADWSAVCDLLATVGYDNGVWPCNTDPGEPIWDAKTGTYTWRLPLAAPAWASQPTGAELN
jgi:hypothetical protein